VILSGLSPGLSAALLAGSSAGLLFLPGRRPAPRVRALTAARRSVLTQTPVPVPLPTPRESLKGQEAGWKVGWRVLGVVSVAVLNPWLAAPAALVAWGAPVVRARRSRRHREAQVVAEAPDLVELFRLAIGAGLTVHLAVGAVTSRARGVTGRALAQVPGRVAVGERLADALEKVADCGDGIRPLVTALVASERYGVALGPSLERVALEARLVRRRNAEEAARRLPVLQLFPLVLCILPAFGLLTVVPLLMGSLPRLTA
jgi:hypothetical protein